MGTLYENHMSKLIDRYGVSKLDVTRNAPSVPQVVKEDSTPSKHSTNHIQAMRERWHLPNGLNLVGQATPEKKSLADYVTEQATISRHLNGDKLATAQVQYKQAPLRLWLQISR